MTDQFKILSHHEWELLRDALPLIAILIAGADGEIEDDEISWSKKVTHIRSYKLKAGLKAFYEEVDRDFESKFTHFVEVLPGGVKERTEIITNKLVGINPILSKLDPGLASKLYKSFISFAEQVAKASGGVIGFFTINKAEAKLLNLPMIHPVHYSASEEEE